METTFKEIGMNSRDVIRITNPDCIVGFRTVGNYLKSLVMLRKIQVRFPRACYVYNVLKYEYYKYLDFLSFTKKFLKYTFQIYQMFIFRLNTFKMKGKVNNLNPTEVF